MTDHPMQPSPEQFAEWLAEACLMFPKGCPGDISGHVARRAYAAGADAELEKVCSEIVDGVGRIHLDSTKDRILLASAIRDARRPKPPSLKEQALAQLQSLEQEGALGCNVDAIRRALNTLSD